MLVSDIGSAGAEPCLGPWTLLLCLLDFLSSAGITQCFWGHKGSRGYCQSLTRSPYGIKMQWKDSCRFYLIGRGIEQALPTHASTYCSRCSHIASIFQFTIFEKSWCMILYLFIQKERSCLKRSKKWWEFFKSSRCKEV